MQTRTFQAGNMTEALQLVKAEMGADAMIISSRQERRKGLLGLFRKPVFMITAAVEEYPPRRNARLHNESNGDDSAREEFRRSLLEPLAREIKELRVKVETLAKQGDSNKSNVSNVAAPVRKSGSSSNVPGNRVPQEQPAEEFRDFSNILLETASNDKAGKAVRTRNTKAAPKSKASGGSVAVAEPVIGDLGPVSSAFHEAGVGQKAISALARNIRTEEKQAGDGKNIKQQLKYAVEKTVKCSGPIKMKKSGPKIVALVGPTGVGKTTTIAKLAALYTVGRNARIALVTIDTFRVGAVEQIKTYSRIMGVPLVVASSPREVEKALNEHSDKDLILIDTTGRSPKDRETIESLREMLSCSFPIEIHLCVASTTRERELREIVESYSTIPVSRLLFTKLDESASFGSIINLQVECKLPLSYFTKGQRVPEDIEPVSSKKVADLILGED